MGKEDFALKAQGWGAIIPIVVYNCPHKPKERKRSGVQTYLATVIFAPLAQLVRATGS